MAETTAAATVSAAAGVLRRWIERYGALQASYTDWKNVYVRPPNAEERERGEPAVTQFGRMRAKLGIRTIAASSPQAKGRKLRVAANDHSRRRSRSAWFAALGSRTRIGASELAGAVRGRSLQRKQTRLQQQHHQGEIAGQFTGGNE